MHGTTQFSISVILLINAVLLVQGTKTAAGGVPGIWDQGMADLPQLQKRVRVGTSYFREISFSAVYKLDEGEKC